MASAPTGDTAIPLPRLREPDHPGFLLVIEGTDGAGKSTLLNRVTHRLQSTGHDVLTTFQPTPATRAHGVFRALSESGGADLDLYRALYLLTLGDRLFHVDTVVMPHLRAGGVVICDRYVYTTMANIMAREQQFEPWFAEAAGHLLRPDLSVLAHCPLDIAVQRIRSRPEEVDRPIDLDHMGRVHQAFRTLEKDGWLRGIDTSVHGIDECADLVTGWVADGLSHRSAR
ncbi:deoxynucleoside kinase [Streptomyces phyllanthi]|uniref:Thymidylate kinase n=1 Tax=Streptomyces phyllanthi TaxID=1803180 RepID=A0A5N8VY57_9ACTN|nr:deoxynucleoside kinase [Streptomyces phyllanthi]MPY38968.1 hypothetical protein [Streptomyces phyllanthi]